MKFAIVYILLFLSVCTYAQDINIGFTETIQSEQLQEKREYLVYLPEQYSNEKYKSQQYPVIYLLDGEKFFHVMSGIVKNLSTGYYPVMPECIIVAIKNTNRSRDLTPTQVSDVGYDSGGADTFSSFITTELMPKINKTYRTLGYNVLVGHSFGGLFVINTLFKNTNTFNAYIAIDPSLWWDNALFVNQLDDYLQTTDFNKKALFLANANALLYKNKTAKQDDAHSNAKELAIEKMNITAPKHLNFNIKYYPEEDHGSVVLPAFIDGFRTVFKGYRVNVKEVMNNPAVLKTHFQMVSENLGINFKSQCAYIDRVVDLMIERDLLDHAKILNELNMELYPKNDYLKTKFK
ncbi:alpha/beta hydrolase-fold protein [uncultured Formosa sp.]|uniref:alpha/beta hydrolase n=1 Tax=uncultured Formosa sp. TaxID=255435 RepID=UPI0026124903|nr:alpha/beta hydrolase-fold protein [uncultured Formosa sp.]